MVTDGHPESGRTESGRTESSVRTESLAANGNPHNGTLANAAPGTLTVWSDIGCPWASLALNTVRERARDRGKELVVDHRVFPLELFNNQPTPKFIVDAEVVAIGGVRPDVRGAGRAEIYADWSVAQGPEVQGSPHLFTANGFAAHNPGATYHWTAAPPAGLPRLESYSADWADDLLDQLTPVTS